ncbi:MAG TPA: 30S ribosomal protein S21 [Saprospiraceae bacterium]|nr:30S ribosomal protein S21 [Saprospiraceae bacterium]MCB9271150.1 30S ribosomal protein S21 [Lewinellaceae bacterium]HPG09488.1 30S ribosomal protein S21 [Saprospiraceae bacterium]HPR01245.1 30S ribosomal protein S21 [Saprospiraceae bacterium]HQU51851.1 30S ribosomal protein S21 [Saprospiraceae bacterium]
MLIIEVKEGESIDRALKRYKRKHRQINLMRQLRDRKYFTKPSEARRNEILKAQYRNEKTLQEIAE